MNAGYSYIDPVRSQTSASFLTDGKNHRYPNPYLPIWSGCQADQNVTMSLTGRTYSETRVADSITGNTRVPAVTVLDASVRYVIRAWDLQLLVKNLTNNSYELGGTAVRPLARQGIDIEELWGINFSESERFKFSLKYFLTRKIPFCKLDALSQRA